MSQRQQQHHHPQKQPERKVKVYNLCTQFITHTRRLWKTCNVRFLLCFIYLNNLSCSSFAKAHKDNSQNIKMNDKMFVGCLYFIMMIANGLWSFKYEHSKQTNKQQQKNWLRFHGQLIQHNRQTFNSNISLTNILLLCISLKAFLEQYRCNRNETHKSSILYFWTSKEQEFTVLRTTDIC